MHLGQRDGERESGAEDGVCEAVRRDVGGGAERHAIHVQDASFGHHLNLFLKVAASRRRAVDTAAAGENGVAAAAPIDGVRRRGREQREQPVGLQVDSGNGNRWGGYDFRGHAHGFGEIGRKHGGRHGRVGEGRLDKGFRRGRSELDFRLGLREFIGAAAVRERCSSGFGCYFGGRFGLLRDGFSFRRETGGWIRFQRGRRPLPNGRGSDGGFGLGGGRGVGRGGGGGGRLRARG